MKYRIFARYENGYRVIGYRWSMRAASKFANQFMAGLDPDTDDFPEMEIEIVRGPTI